MPPTTSDSRKSREQSTVELRRARGEISCAECRRLKLKCDKTVPCSSCVRRGCSELCPNRAQVTVHGSKQSSAEIDRLRAKIRFMSKRIRQLEDALAVAHSSASLAPHPLLSAHSPGADTGSPDAASELADSDVETELSTEKDNASLVDSSVLQSFSELAITDCYSTHSAGEPGEAEELLKIIQHDGSRVVERPIEDGRTVPRTVPSGVEHLSRAFPFAPIFAPAHEIQETIFDLLPTYERATSLAEAYLENISWFFRPVSREQIMEELLPAAYKNRKRTRTPVNGSSPPTSSNRMDPHELALLIAVFAIGAVADLTLAPTNDEGELFYHTARAALGLKSVFDSTQLATVQAIGLIASYDLFACQATSLEGSYKMMNMSCSLGVQLGLHRDPARWKLSEKMIQRRRMLFWELYGLDTCNIDLTEDVRQTLCTGRPSVFRSSIVECQFPDDPLGTLKEDGTKLPSVWLWRARFVKDVVSEIVEKLSSARNLKYSEILALDRKIRSFDPNDVLRQSAFLVDPTASEGGLTWYLQRYTDVVIKGNTLALLHRNFFARAILENPADPSRSVFGPSFLAAYRAAVVALRVIRENFDAIAHLLLRVWPMWAHALANCVIIGSVAALGVKSPLAPEAFQEFDKAIGLFAKGQMHPVAKSGLPILLRLRERAFRALTPEGSSVSGVISMPREALIEELTKEGPQPSDFNVVNSMGRIFKKAAKGEFDVAAAEPQTLMNNYTTTDVSKDAGSAHRLSQGSSFPSSAYAKHQVRGLTTMSRQTHGRRSTDDDMGLTNPSGPGLFSQMPGSSPIPNGPGGLFQSPPSPGRSSYMGMTPDSFFAPSPFSRSSGGSQSLFGGSPSHPSPPRSVSGDSNGSGSRPDTSPPPGANASSSSFNAPAFSTPSPFTTFGMPSLDAFQSGGGTDAQPMAIDASADFDVSHDLRLATGEENPLAMLPQDMEAWRAIFEDPRMLTGFRSEDVGV